MFTDRLASDDLVAPTNTASGALARFYEGEKYSAHDFIATQTFPEDYDFGDQVVQYICGMSVPPVMMAQIAREVYEQWLK